MEVEFKSKSLAKIETKEAHKTKLPVSVIHSARKKLRFLRDAPDEQTLLAWKSLRYEKLLGNRSGTSSIRLNDQWRMLLSVDNSRRISKALIISIEDYHK